MYHGHRHGYCGCRAVPCHGKEAENISECLWELWVLTPTFNQPLFLTFAILHIQIAVAVIGPRLRLLLCFQGLAEELCSPTPKLPDLDLGLEGCVEIWR
jgi:hypothetical protein